MNRLKKQYPVKASVNLLCKEKRNASVLQTVIAVTVFAVVLALFSKFAVIDRLAASGRALREAERMEEMLAQVQQSNRDYDDVLRKYQHYYFSAADRQGENGTAETYVNCMEVLALLDEELLNKAGIQMVNLTGNVLTVNLTKINLERASAIAKSLKANKMVKEVMVSAANRQNEAAGTTVYMNIVLETKKESEAKADDGTEEVE